MYLRKNEVNECNKCSTNNDTVEHVLLHCEAHKDTRNTYIKELETVYPAFKDLSQNSKIHSLLMLTPFDEICDKDKYFKIGINWVSTLLKEKFS